MVVVLALVSLVAACTSGATSPAAAPTTPAAATTTPTAASSAGPSASTATVQTITAGQLTVAVDQDMPYDGVGTDGKVTGVLGDVVTEIANKLGLQLNLQQMDFAPGLQAVTSGRVDTLLDCAVDTPAREGIYHLTQKFFYIPLEISQRKATDFKAIEDLKGHTLGTIQGYSEVPLFQAIPYIGNNLKQYPTFDAMLQDLLAGRLDAFSVGSPTTAWAITQHPEYDLKYNIMTPTPLLPETQKYNGCIFPVSLSNTTLVPAMDAVITQMKSNGDLAAILAKYSMTDPVFITGN